MPIAKSSICESVGNLALPSREAEIPLSTQTRPSAHEHEAIVANNGPYATSLRIIEGQARTLVRIRAPAGLSTVYLLSGECLSIPADRLVLVDESGAAPLLAGGFERIESAAISAEAAQ